MAGDGSTNLEFTTNIAQIVADVGAGMSRLVAEVEQAGGSLDGVDFGTQVAKNFEAGMLRIRQAAAEAARSASASLNEAGRAATPSSPFVAPSGGALNTQIARIEADTVRANEQLARNLSAQAPQFASIIQQLGRRGSEAVAAEVRRIGAAGGEQFAAVRAEKAAQGVALPLRSAVTGGGQQTAAGDRRINQAFPELTDAQLAEVDTFQTQKRSASAVRAAATRKERAAAREAAAADSSAASAEEAAAADRDATAAEKRSASARKGAATKRAQKAETLAAGGLSQEDVAANIRAAQQTGEQEAADRKAKTTAETLRTQRGLKIDDSAREEQRLANIETQAAQDRAQAAKDKNLYGTGSPPVAPFSATKEEAAQQDFGQTRARAEREYSNAIIKGGTDTARQILFREEVERRYAAAQDRAIAIQATREKVLDKAAQLQLEQAQRADLAARKAAGTAFAVPGGGTRTVPEDDHFKNLANNRAVQLSGAELADSQARAVKQFDAQAQTAGRQAAVGFAAYDKRIADEAKAAEETAKADAELANAKYVAANYITRAGNLYQTPKGIYQETEAGAKQVEGELRLLRANEALAAQREREAVLEARTTGKGFIGSFVQSATSRSAFSGGSGGESVPVLDKLGGRLGSLTETFAGFAVLGIAIKAIADTKTEVVAYTSALNNLEVVTGRTDIATSGFTNDLESLSRLAGSNVSDQIDAATRVVAAFGDASSQSAAQLQALGEKGATAASILAVNSGTTLKVASNNLIAAGTSFGLKGDALSQITDAAAHAQKAPLGGERDVITEALAYGAETFKAAGYNPQQAADIASLGTARTNESGQAYATKFATISQLFGSHQDTLQGLGVDTTGTIKQQIEQLAPIYDKLSASEQKHTLAQLAGRTAQRELLPLLTEQAKLTKADNENDAGAGITAFAARNATLAGLFRKIAGDITSIQLNLARTGVFNGIGVALKLLEPGLRTLSDLLGLVDNLIGALGPLGKFPGIILDSYLALKLLASVGRLPALVGAFVPRLAETAPLPGLITKRAPILAPRGAAGAAGKEAEAAATEGDTAATEANTAAKAANAAATARASEAEAARAAAMTRGVVVTDANAVSVVALQEAIDLEVLALAELTGAQDLELKIQGTMIGENQAEIGSLEVLAKARQEQIVLLDAMAAAQTAAARAALAEAEAQSAASLANRSGFLGLGIGNRVKAARAGKAAAAGEGAVGAEAAAGAGSGLAAGLGVLAIGALAGDALFNSINESAKKTKASLDDTATALDNVGKAATPDDLSNAAASLRTAADERAKSTSGIVGSTLGFFTKYTGGGDSNADAKNDRQAADLEDARAKAKAARLAREADLGNPSVFNGKPNSIDDITNAFKLMDAAGERATTKMLALNAALGGLPGTGSGPGHILPGGGGTLADTIGSKLVDTETAGLSQAIADDEKRRGKYAITGRQDAAAKLLLSGRKFDSGSQDEFFAAEQFSTKDLDDTKNKSPLANSKKAILAQQAAEAKLTDLVSKAGLDNGGVITDAMALDWGKQLAELYVDPNETKKQLALTRAKLGPLYASLILKSTDSSKIPVDQGTSAFIQQQEIPFAQAAGTETLAATGGDQVKAAQAVLDAQKANNAAALATKDSTGKHNHLTQQAIDATTAAEFGLSDALSARAQVFDEAAKNQLAADDAIGRAAVDVNSAIDQYVADLAAGKPDVILAADKTRLTNANRASDQTLLDKKNAGILDKVPANNATASATAALQVARNNLKATDKKDDTKAYRDAVKAVDDAKLVVLNAKIADAQATIRAGANPNDQTGLLKIAAAEAKQAYELIKKSHAGAKEVSDAFIAMHLAEFTFLQSAEKDAEAKILAGVDPNDKSAVAAANSLISKMALKFDASQNVKGKALYDDQAAAQSAGAASATNAVDEANFAAEAAVKVGDSYGEAVVQYLNDIRTANSKFGAERAKLLRDAAVQKVVAEKLAVDIAHGARVNAIDPRDELALAREALRNDQAAQGVAGQPTEQAQQEVLQGKQDALAVQQALAARNAAKLTSQVRQGDPLSGAAAALTIAKDNLKLDEVGTLKYFQDLASVKQAAVAYAQAFRDRARENLLLAGDTTDPLTQARADLVSATAKLEDDKRKKTGDLRQDQINKETAAQALQKAQFDQQLQQQQTAYGLGQESSATFLKFLHDTDSSLRSQLAGMKKGQEGYQQLVDELNTVDQAIQSANNQLSGQFNLGDIKLPTVYEVRRQVASSAAGQNIDASASTVVNNVNINGADFAAVVAYITSILGNRGGSRVATTGRKAA